MISHLSKKFVRGTTDDSPNSTGSQVHSGPKASTNGVSTTDAIAPLDPEVEEALRSAGIPLVHCQECPAPCDPAHPTTSASDLLDGRLLSAWSKQDIDHDSPMFPSNGPFLRHILISTGKRDWPHDITSVKGTLADLFTRWAEEDLQVSTSSDPPSNPAETKVGAEQNTSDVSASIPVLPKGCWSTSPGAVDRPSRLLVGNSSHISASHHSHGQSVMLLPDYEILCDVQDATEVDPASSVDVARSAYEAYVSASTTKEAMEASRKQGVRRYVLPYKALVVLCSHKKRDVRCGISAPLLADVLRRHAEADGWQVDERGDDIGHPSSLFSPSSQSRGRGEGMVSEEGEGEEDLKWSDQGLVTNRGWGYIHSGPSPCGLSPESQSNLWRRSLSSSSSSSSSAPSSLPLPPAHPTLGIFYTSHIGKHKFAGNLLVYFPNRAGVWYGRVDPLNGAAGQVWQQTILAGNVIPEFLRVAMNLWRGGTPTVTPTRDAGLRGKGEGDEGDKSAHRVSGLPGDLRAEGEHQPGILQW